MNPPGLRVSQRFWASPEDQLDVFSKFYGLPSLSWRDAVHDLIATNATGFTVADLYFDKGHPNGYNGHRHACATVTHPFLSRNIHNQHNTSDDHASMHLIVQS